MIDVQLIFFFLFMAVAWTETGWLSHININTMEAYCCHTKNMKLSRLSIMSLCEKVHVFAG